MLGTSKNRKLHRSWKKKNQNKTLYMVMCCGDLQWRDRKKSHLSLQHIFYTYTVAYRMLKLEINRMFSS